MSDAFDAGILAGLGGDRLYEKNGENARTVTETTDAAAGVTTTYTISPGDTFYGGLGYDGDRDWVGLDLRAGETYTITMTADSMQDPYLWLLDSSGGVLAQNDFGPGPGVNSQIIFTPTTSGTYYIVADSYYTQPGVAGTDTGRYSVSVISGLPPQDPLDAITWGYTAPSTINVYFVQGGALFADLPGTLEVTSSWSPYEQAQAMLAFELFENVANVSFNVVTDPSQADFMMVESADHNLLFPGYWEVGSSQVTIDSTSYSVDGYGVIYGGNASWGNLEQGSEGFATLIHEIGHGLGLAHPHDTGGTSTVMNGVTSTFGDLGDFNLNQGIYTAMTFNNGWQTAPQGPSISPLGTYGYQGTPMAFDVAVIQSLYGANMSYNTGNDIYVLPTTNGPGPYWNNAFYSSIWDAGGNDTIVVTLGVDAVIDLREAPLTYADNGGGYVSYASGISAGFTIASGAVIENGVGHGGDDRITGNDAGNILVGSIGNDSLNGGAGTDILVGGLADGGASDLAGNDSLNGEAGNDIIFGEAGNDTLNGGTGGDILSGGAGVDLATGGAGGDIFAYTLGDGVLTITDFEAGVDDLAIIGAPAGTTFADVAPLLSQDGLDVVIGGGATEIRWQNTLVADLGADDFIFV